MTKLFGHLSTVSILTLSSRFLGLARDIIFFGCFGASLVGEAFILAFTFPNLFRRMLGEGTLTSAFIPIFTEALKNKSKQIALGLLNQVTSRLLVILGVLSGIVILLSLLMSQDANLVEEKWELGFLLNSISFGYVLLICTSAILVGALNSMGSFFEGAFSPVILNLCMILSMVVGKYFLGLNLNEMALLLCVSVMFGGVLQLCLPWVRLKNIAGWSFEFNRSDSQELEQIKTLFMVGALGAAVRQVNILVSRILAYSLEDSGGLSYLFLSSRLVELPLGVFAIAIATVFFPEMSKASNEGNSLKFWEKAKSGLRLTAAITIPSAVGLMFLASPILISLFLWGEFGLNEVEESKKILQVSCLGLPFYAFSTFLVKIFHSMKNMHYPLRAAVVSLISNLALSLLLMPKYQVFGLAWANVISALIQTIYLWIRLKKMDIKDTTKTPTYHVFIILFSVGLMSLLLFFAENLHDSHASKLDCIIYLCIAIPTAAIIYFLSMLFLGFPEIKEFYRIVLAKFANSNSKR